MNKSRALYFALCVTALAEVQSTDAAIVLYSQGFELNATGWDTQSDPFLNAIRVASGEDGIPSASGGFHANNALLNSVLNPDELAAFTRWGGYNFGAGRVPTAFQEYWTSLDIYLDTDAGWANNTRFDFNSSINNNLGQGLRDFIFNAGFYNTADGSPGSGTSRFVIGASNNSQNMGGGSTPGGNDPIAISSTGWYTFESHFYDRAGVLAVDLSIFDASHSPVKTWTLSNPADLIGTVGGNNYGWFNFNQFSTLAFDNSNLTVIPEIGQAASSLVLLLGMGGLVFANRRPRKSATGAP